MESQIFGKVWREVVWLEDLKDCFFGFFGRFGDQGFGVGESGVVGFPKALSAWTAL